VLQALRTGEVSTVLPSHQIPAERIPLRLSTDNLPRGGRVSAEDHER